MEKTEEVQVLNPVNINTTKVVCSGNWNTFEKGPADYHENFLNHTFFSSVVDEYFSYSPDRSQFVVKNMESPILFSGVFYFWAGYKKEIPMNQNMSSLIKYLSYSQCTYTITNKDKQLDNVTSPNGTKLESLEFQCNAKYCCGLTCCSQLGYDQKYMKKIENLKKRGPMFLVFTMTVSGAFLTIAAIIYALFKIKKSRFFSISSSNIRIIVQSPNAVTPRSVSPVNRNFDQTFPHVEFGGPLSINNVITKM